MSLVSSDSEGEQNELRNLQEKLESTMKLVTNLSGQLSELKDQVKGQTPHLAPTPYSLLSPIRWKDRQHSRGSNEASHLHGGD